MLDEAFRKRRTDDAHSLRRFDEAIERRGNTGDQQCRWRIDRRREPEGIRFQRNFHSFFPELLTSSAHRSLTPQTSFSRQLELKEREFHVAAVLRDRRDAGL